MVRPQPGLHYLRRRNRHGRSESSKPGGATRRKPLCPGERPTPLVRATGLERALKTPARIYFKDESHSPPGSHKPNTAVPQAYYNKVEGIHHLSTETGAGQWGTSLAFACSFFGIECNVFMVKVSYQQKPYRRSMMRVWGATVIPSPSNQTQAGCQILAADPLRPQRKQEVA